MSNRVTQILETIQRGNPNAAEELLPLVYEELRKLAAAKLAREASGQTLQATALVHEAWLRVAGSGNPHFVGRPHFFAAAAEAMRRIPIDRARRKQAVRHGGHQERVEFVGLEMVFHIGSWTQDAGFFPDGHAIFTRSLDGKLRIWEAATPEQMAAWDQEEETGRARIEAQRLKLKEGNLAPNR